MQNNILKTRSNIENLIDQFKLLPAGNIQKGQQILDKLSNSRLSSYLKNQDISQINQALRKKKSLGKNFGILRKKTIGDLYPTLQQFQMQQQYHSKGFKEKKQTERIKNRNQRQKREEQKRLKRQEEQRFTAQSEIVDKVLNLPKLPPTIEYDSFESLSYFTNYKGFNRDGLAPPKNIINIGEKHFKVDSGFFQFEDFLDSLIKKNKYVGDCIDLIFESFLDHIAKPLLQQQGDQKINRDNLTSDYQGNILTINQHTETLYALRTRFYKHIKGFRAHSVDTRSGFKGLFNTLIGLSIAFDIDKNNRYKYNRYLLQYVYDFYTEDDGKQDDIVEKNKIEVEKYIFNGILSIDVEKKRLDYIQTLQGLTKLNVSTMNSQMGNMFSFMANSAMSGIKELDSYKSFIDSIKNFIVQAIGKEKFKENGYQLKNDDMKNVNRSMYYKYLDKIGSVNLNDITRKISQNRNMDLKFRKQINNLDERYFHSDPKTTIMLWYLQISDIRWGDTSLIHNFYEIHLICRLFRKFDYTKNRYTSCDNENKSMRNVILYSGNDHSKNIILFLQNLPNLGVKTYTVFGEGLITRLYFFDADDTNKIFPKFCTGDVYGSYGIFDFLECNTKDVNGIPTNIDYFDLNNQIIQKLKDKYNVRQYTQLPKAIQQEEQKQKQKKNNGDISGL